MNKKNEKTFITLGAILLLICLLVIVSQSADIKEQSNIIAVLESVVDSNEIIESRNEEKLNILLEKQEIFTHEIEGLDEEIQAYKEDISQIRSQRDKIEEQFIKLNEEKKYNEEMDNLGPRYVNRLHSFSNGILRYANYPLVERYTTIYSIDILGHGERMSEVQKVVDVTRGGKTTFTFNISGSLYNFRIAIVEFNEAYDNYDVVEEVCHFEEINDTDVLFDSGLAEGFPNELLTWEDDQGRTNYYLIGDIGMGDVITKTFISGLVNLEPFWEQ